jgi:predicted O-linked N-acetylglucosamine transferase (SPINDLY family)
MPYAPYLDSLARCDFCIGTFPFGGASSIQDALGLGLPVVSMEGPEPQCRTEPRLVRLAGLPDWLIANSIDTYVEIARRLPDDDEARNSLRDLLNINRLESRLFDEHADIDNADFADAVAWLIEHHDRLRALDQPIWSVTERAAGAPATES